MANGFGSLERFFVKKKAPAALNDQAQPASAPSTIPQFPSPSFIRPKASRMAAREEVRKQPASRVPSFPGPVSPQQMDFTNIQSPTSRSDSHQSQYSPLKTSFMPTQAEPFLDNFDVYKFPRPPTSQGGTSASSSTRDPKSSMEAPSERSLPLRSPRKREVGASRLETPPSSDLEDEAKSSPKYLRDKELPALPQQKPPTPDSSPELRPLHIAQLTASKSIDILNKAVYRDIRRHFTKTLDQRPLQKAASLTSQEPYANRLSISSSTLREPDFNEFFELSDDDIAELAPEETADVEAMPCAAYSTPGSTRSSLLVLTPPLHASKPAVAGAFEAARIAARYDFDFVYVVNLWTDNSQTQSDVSTNLDSPGKKFRPLAGRLLASYGMENVNAPVQISTASHRKILKTPGWIEYRPQSFRDDEFARGYAHAFHTGRGSEDGSATSRNSASSSASMQSSNPNRGIVFAAYRAPRADGSLACTKADLINLHKDAEALVEMLVDINVTSQLREPRSQSRQSEETGPMPTRRFGICEADNSEPQQIFLR
ncbi:hypothetical protein FLONG3_10213 [Fusarium longipes]|uniref:Uncharacterized protein n=1 Tax=Fusarium longipes TaxID=694270 RepID=A0A395RR40_9HYPO|nr:hypothetical protein FLONG3_10213 [Fusarium longipes]